MDNCPIRPHLAELDMNLPFDGEHQPSNVACTGKLHPPEDDLTAQIFTAKPCDCQSKLSIAQPSSADCPTIHETKRKNELKLAHFPVIYSMSLARPPVSDALGTSKGVMSQDLDVSLHCHSNLQRQCQRGDFSSGADCRTINKAARQQ
jgi:hypothetical protein